MIQNEHPLHQFFQSWCMESLLVKVASRCNFDCTYCYWFRDPEVNKLPKVMSKEIESCLFNKIENHIKKYHLKTFSLTFHGGEPLLFGLKRFEELLKKCDELEHSLDCVFKKSIQSNGALINDDWALLFKKYKINPGISLDGPIKIHNKYRKKLGGGDTFHLTTQGISILKNHQIDFGLLAVCDPQSDPKMILDYFVNTLKVDHFDILIPDYTHDDQFLSIADYYIQLFDD